MSDAKMEILLKSASSASDWLLPNTVLLEKQYVVITEVCIKSLLKDFKEGS